VVSNQKPNPKNTPNLPKYPCRRGSNPDNSYLTNCYKSKVNQSVLERQRGGGYAKKQWHERLLPIKIALVLFS
jgi:hypothetical protein